MNIAVLASGTGTTLQTLINEQQKHGYRVALVVANRPCQALERAQNHHIPTLLSKDWQEIDQVLMGQSVELIVLAGYLAIVPAWICEKWQKRIINIHPSLLPKHGGKGMYGMHVHQAVVDAHERESGCTVHYVNAGIDEGNIIAQAKVEVLPHDTPETLAERVQKQEKYLLPRVIGKLAKDLFA